MIIIIMIVIVYAIRGCDVAVAIIITVIIILLLQPLPVVFVHARQSSLHASATFVWNFMKYACMCGSVLGWQRCRFEFRALDRLPQGGLTQK